MSLDRLDREDPGELLLQRLRGVVDVMSPDWNDVQLFAATVRLTGVIGFSNSI